LLDEQVPQLNQEIATQAAADTGEQLPNVQIVQVSSCQPNHPPTAGERQAGEHKKSL
jgi:hypothetical protein